MLDEFENIFELQVSNICLEWSWQRLVDSTPNGVLNVCFYFIYFKEVYCCLVTHTSCNKNDCLSSVLGLLSFQMVKLLHVIIWLLLFGTVFGSFFFHILTLLHSEQPKLHRVLSVLSGTGLIITSLHFIQCFN